MKLLVFLICSMAIYSLNIFAGWWDTVFFCCASAEVGEELVCSFLPEDETNKEELSKWRVNLVNKMFQEKVINCGLIPLNVFTRPIYSPINGISPPQTEE